MMALQKEPQICPACQQQGNFRFLRDHQKKDLPDRQAGKTFSLYECASCHVQIWMPVDLADAKQSEIYKVRNAVHVGNNRAYHRKFLSRNKPFVAGTKILDLGCGTGEFLSHLHALGCEVWGVDFDDEAIKTAKDHFGLDAVFAEPFTTFLQRSDLPKFDHVVFFEVIQYVNNPAEFVQNVEKLLKPTGTITISVPCRRRMLVNGSAWDFAPGPFTRWDELAIINLFKRFGFSPSYMAHVEEFKILSDAISGRLKTGFIGKNLAYQKRGIMFSLFLRIVYFFGFVKQYAISIIPAGVLWVLGKVMKSHNGIMFVEFKRP